MCLNMVSPYTKSQVNSNDMFKPICTCKMQRDGKRSKCPAENRQVTRET